MFNARNGCGGGYLDELPIFERSLSPKCQAVYSLLLASEGHPSASPIKSSIAWRELVSALSLVGLLGQSSQARGTDDEQLFVLESLVRWLVVSKLSISKTDEIISDSERNLLAIISAGVAAVSGPREHSVGASTQVDIQVACPPSFGEMETHPFAQLVRILILSTQTTTGKPINLLQRVCSPGQKLSARIALHLLLAHRGHGQTAGVINLARELIVLTEEDEHSSLLLLTAHIIVQHRLSLDDEAAGLLYFVEENVQYDIVQSLKESLLSSRFQPNHWTPLWQSQAAYALYLMGDYRRAREFFGAITALPQLYPWSLVGGSEGAEGAYQHAKEIVCR